MLNLRKRSVAMVVFLSLSWVVTPALAAGGVGGGGGTGGGGGATTPPPTTTPPPSILPTTPPAPNILIRESFGMADGFRPAGGKGLLRADNIHTTLGGFWVEYPGSKNTNWITPDGNQTWKFAGIGGFLDPYELPSPLQATDIAQGVIVSEWFDAVTQYPTALLPFKQPAAPYSVSMEGWPAFVPGTYVAIGLTASGATLSNFTTVGQVWLSLNRVADANGGLHLIYEWRLNGKTGTLLATGEVVDQTWNSMVIHYDPVAHLVSASIGGSVVDGIAPLNLGVFPLNITPSFAGFEGVGVLDNFVISLIP